MNERKTVKMSVEAHLGADKIPLYSNATAELLRELASSTWYFIPTLLDTLFIEALDDTGINATEQLRAITEESQAIIDRGGRHINDYGAAIFTPANDEDRARLYDISSAWTDLLDRGERAYKEAYTADGERLKADASRVIEALDFKDFALCRLEYILNYNRTAERNPGKEPTAEEKRAKARTRDAYKMLDFYIENQTAPLSEIWNGAHKGTDNKKAWADTLKESRKRLLDIWIKTADKEELAFIGFKIPEPAEPIPRAPMLNPPDKMKVMISNIYDNLIESNLDFLLLPPDGQQMQVFYDPDDGGKGRAIEERPGRHRDKYGKMVNGAAIYSRVYMTTAPGVTLSKELQKVDRTDLTIFTIVVTLLAAGNEEMTAQQIYEYWYNTDRAIPTDAANRIDLFFRKFAARRLGIIFDELVSAGMIPETKENKTVLRQGMKEEQILVYGTESYITKRGTERTKYIIRNMPFIYIFSEWRNLVLSIPLKLYHAGEKVSMTENTINLRHYLITRIRRAKARNKVEPRDTTIMLNTLLPKFLSNFEIVETNDGRKIEEQDIGRQKKKRILEAVKSILDDLKDMDEIAGYEFVTKGKSHEIIKIVFTLPAKEKGKK